MVIGADVSVGEDAVIERSVIGDGCRVGVGAKIVDSYVWAGAEVGDGASVEGAIVASRAMAETPAGGWVGVRWQEILGVPFRGRECLPTDPPETCVT